MIDTIINDPINRLALITMAILLTLTVVAKVTKWDDLRKAVLFVDVVATICLFVVSIVRFAAL